MPQGSQSILPLTSTDFTAVDGTTYKASIDRFTAVGSQICGPFYVYPSSPASMVVRIDSAFTYWCIGIGVVINGGQSVITLTKPTSGTRFATVYWDFTANGPGVAYGISGGPPILPESLNQQPLALVTLTSIATSVVAANIEDIRGFNSFSGPISKSTVAFTTPGQQTNVNVSGANSISIYSSRPTTANTGSANLILSDYRIGTPIFLRFDNSAVNSVLFTLYCITPSGTQLSVQEKGFGGTGLFVIGGAGATGVTVPSGTVMTLTGNSIAGLVDLNGS